LDVLSATLEGWLQRLKSGRKRGDSGDHFASDLDRFFRDSASSLLGFLSEKSHFERFKNCLSGSFLTL